MDFRYIFSIPIYSVNIKDKVDVNLITKQVNELESSMEKYQSKQKNQNKYISTFQEEIPLLDKDFCIDLKKEVNNHLEQFAKSLKIKTPKLANSWANILSKDCFVDAHEHNESILSGSFYPNSTDESAPFICNNPFNSFLNELPYKNLPTLWKKFYEVQPEIGLLVLFPSCLFHSTGENNKMNNRITISINTTYNDEQVQKVKR